MDIRVLGPVEVLAGRERLGLGGPKQRALLGLLVSAAPAVVPAALLEQGIWGEEPRAGARSTLQTYASNLRRAIGDVIVHDRGGYRLAVDPSTIDALRFVAALEEARPIVTTAPARAGDLRRCPSS